MSRHRQQRQPTNYKYWLRYLLYRLGIALANHRATTIRNRITNKTKHTQQTNRK